MLGKPLTLLESAAGLAGETAHGFALGRAGTELAENASFFTRIGDIAGRAARGADIVRAGGTLANDAKLAEKIGASVYKTASEVTNFSDALAMGRGNLQGPIANSFAAQLGNKLGRMFMSGEARAALRAAAGAQVKEPGLFTAGFAAGRNGALPLGSSPLVSQRFSQTPTSVHSYPNSISVHQSPTYLLTHNPS